MKQVLQNIRDGKTEVVSVPAPTVSRGEILVRTQVSLISAGTERMLVKFGRSGWLAKARQQPDKVKMVLEKVQTDGLLATADAVSSKLDQPLALGYSNVGVVVECGKGVLDFKPGDRVVSNGNHAEYVAVPSNLAAVIPEQVLSEHAAFAVVAAIGLQGVRLANPTLGECVVVTGLGLIGLLTVQVLIANGCRVLGIDFDESKLNLARSFGAETVDLGKGEDALSAARRFSRGRGVDAVIITAATTSDRPVHEAAVMSRKRGRIVLVGVAGLKLSRADFYEKELSFQVSCSYGPGRYDNAYEKRGHDYPIGYVRWTEQRNFEAVLDMMDARKLQLDTLITHRFAIDDAVSAYETLVTDNSALGIVLDYDTPTDEPVRFIERVTPTAKRTNNANRMPAVTVIGAGNYAGRVLLPALKESGAKIHTIVSNTGVSAAHFSRKFDAECVSSDVNAAIENPEIDLVVIATRHDSHADLVIQGLNAGKCVFVEKPLCLTLAQQSDIETALPRSSGTLMVGFNRRFSPLIDQAKELLSSVDGPKSMIITVNAGAVPDDHWTRDVEVGGGRIVGEACHFIDLLRFLAGCRIKDSQICAIGPSETRGPTAESAVISLKFEDGSLGTVQYLTGGHNRFPKERIEIFTDGRILQLNNFRNLVSWGWPESTRRRLWRQDKGQRACIKATVDAVHEGKAAPIPKEEILEVSRVSLELRHLCG